MSQKNTVQLKRKVPSTHYFVHKGKQYPFNIELFKISSNYFSKNENYLEQNKYIDLLDHSDASNLDINDETINNFIQYIQRNPIQIHNQNVIALNYLGHKYEIDELIESTEEYISNHHSELSLDYLTFHPEESSDNTSFYENTISEHFQEYIDDDRLFNLNIPTLYRIFKKYQEAEKSKNQKQQQTDKIFTFLFKCLDKYGKSASVLFDGFEFDKIRPDFMNLLMTKYSQVLDFHYMNSNILKLLYKNENELFVLLKKNEERDKELNEFIQTTIEKINGQSQEKLDEIKREQEVRFEKMEKQHKESLIELKEKLENEEAKNKELEKKIDQMRIEFLKMLDDEKKERNKIISDNMKMLDQFKEDVQDMIGIVKIPYSNDSSKRFKGILSHLGNGDPQKALDDKIIDIKASSVYGNYANHQPRCVLNQISSDNFYSKNEPNSWLFIDFKEIKVNPSHYSIKSNGWSGKGNHHPQSWDIEGSTDLISWDLLDSRRNETSLDDRDASNTFTISCQTNKRKYYRYLRIMQKDKNTANNNHLVIGSIEFFGQIQK